MSIIAIITARGGSKGLPRKNVLELAGKPLIAHTIDAALQSKIFEKVIVTTDDQEIKEVSLKYGAEVIDRPDELATDTASSLDVIEHTLLQLKENGEEYSHFILLQPTSPLRNAIHIQEAWKKYVQEKASSLVSVTEVEHPPQKMLIEKDGKIEPLTTWEDLTKPRQSLPKAYEPNGAIYICNIEKFLDTKNIFLEPLKIFHMDKKDSTDID
ncbi:MAG: acylneuraminate cytidylyltransferase family protein, partial [Campylobacterales bacterium]|nr:acylneuraminate cytidylyltransferase family protein [Campylobacterales bacterium]